MSSNKFVNVNPRYNIVINEAQRELLHHALNVVSSNPVYDDEDTAELRKLAFMLQTAEQDPDFGLHAQPVTNALCV